MQKPEITGQRTLIIFEDNPITLTTSDFTIIEDEEEDEDELKLKVFEGNNYSLSENTVTPLPDFYGTLLVPVAAKNKEGTSNIFNAVITVTQVDDPPVITGQVPLQINEDAAIALAFEHFTVSDPDNVYPNGFSMTVSPGSNYSVSGTTVTPNPNFNGTLSVPVVVNDGVNNSAPYHTQITVNPINDPPSITGQATLQTNEEQPITIDFSQISVSDADHAYPTGFTMTLSPGSGYTVSGSTVTPATDFNGTLSVPVTVNDGTDNSAPFNLQIQVLALNDVPVITGQVPININEDQPVTIELSHLTVTDPDNTYPSGFSLSIAAGNNYTVSGNTVTPATGFSGVLSVGVTVNDGLNVSAPYNLQIQVASVNTPPVITGQATLETNEDQPITIQLGHLAVSDPDNSYPAGFTLSVAAGGNYTASVTTIVPAVNFSGVLTVNVTVNDGISSSAPFPLQVSVLPVNDAPVITGQIAIEVYKDTPFTIELTHLIISDPDNTSFTLNVMAGENYTSTGPLVTPGPGFTGTLNVNVTVNDGVIDSQPFAAKVQISRPPNIPPQITGQVTLTTFENQPLMLELSHLIVSDPDNVFPDEFTLSVSPGDNYTLSGTTLIPATNFSGSLIVPVTVSDKAAVSAPFNLSIQVIPVAKVPLITSQSFLKVSEDSTLTIKLSDIDVIDADNTYPNGFTINLYAGANYTVDGLTIIPAPNFNGHLTVPATVNDGTNTSVRYNLLVLVEPVNDPPGLIELETEPLIYSIGKGPLAISESLQVIDADDDSLFFAEISFAAETFEKGDTLIYYTTAGIRGVYDTRAGLLALIGKGSVGDYTQALRSIYYDFRTSSDPVRKNKTLYITLNDGKTDGQRYHRDISLGDAFIALDIPNGFTPNGDGSNDTWNIKPRQGNEQFGKAIIRVYNKAGILVYESTGFNNEWDGSVNGTQLPPDVYFYTIDLNMTYTKDTYKGTVMLLR